MVPNSVWSTLLSKVYYLQAVLVLEQSLRDVRSAYPLIVMVVPDLPEEVRHILRLRNIETCPIEYLKPEEGRHTVDPHDVRFNETWGKLRVFELEQYNRVILLDSDMIVKQNMDELMEFSLPSSDWIAAVHACACNPMGYKHYPKDWTPDNCAYTHLKYPKSLEAGTPILPDSPRPYNLLNSGLVILTPSKKVMAELENFLATSPLVPDFKFPDQDLLAAVFYRRWKPLPWKYNALKTLKKFHTSCWSDKDICCLHYILREKPWHYKRGAAPIEYEYMHVWWWDVYDRVVEELKNTENAPWKLVADQVVD